MSFDNLGLSQAILKAVAEKGYSTPSPIQGKAVPAVLTGKDVMAAAQTGTGKTAGFTLPILERLSGGPKVKPNHARVLVLTPTRELAAQVSDNIHTYGKYLDLSSTVVFGGVKINPQMMRLRKGADILVATPGRLLDLYSQNAIDFSQLEILVLDEADRMLDMGFIHDIRKILAILPKQRQNLMFSATFSDDIRKLAKTIVHDPLEISVAAPNSTVETVKHWIVPVDKKRKSALLVHLIKEYKWEQVLVFSRTKHGANRLATQLTREGLNAAAIHGNKSQGARTKALADFKSGKVHVLVATDIAARGIDISELPHVVNLDLPNVPEDYVHRIGRTGRAGSEGEAISLVSADEHKQLIDIERLIKKLIPREYESGFEPDHEVPESRLDTRPIRPKKPKKPKESGEGDQNSGRQPRNQNNGQRRSNQNGSGNSEGRRNGRRGGNGEGRQGHRHGKPNRNNRYSNQSSSQSSGNRNTPRRDKPLDEDGNINGNVAGVETHESDRSAWQAKKPAGQANKRSGQNSNRPKGGRGSSQNSGHNKNKSRNHSRNQGSARSRGQRDARQDNDQIEPEVERKGPIIKHKRSILKPE